MEHILSTFIIPSSIDTLVCIGEMAHGELISWPLRYKSVKHYSDKKEKVVVLLENANFYVHCKKFKSQGVFYPFLIDLANMTHEHYKWTRMFFDLKHVEFIGIDIQALDMDVNPADYTVFVSKYKSEWDKAKNTELRGCTRNFLNAKIMHDIVSDPKYSAHKKFYFAHNEHIAKSCTNSRNDINYKTDVACMKEFGMKTLSIGTYAKSCMNMWQGHMETTKSTRLNMNRKSDFDVLYTRDEREDRMEHMTLL